MSQTNNDLIQCLRWHNDPRLHREAIVLMSDAADKIEIVTAERDDLLSALQKIVRTHHYDFRGNEVAHAAITKAIRRPTMTD
jgi:hypothetical protein